MPKEETKRTKTSGGTTAYLVIDGFAIRVEEGLELRDHQIDPCLQFWQTIADMMHQQLKIVRKKKRTKIRMMQQPSH